MHNIIYRILTDAELSQMDVVAVAERVNRFTIEGSGTGLFPISTPSLPTCHIPQQPPNINNKRILSIFVHNSVSLACCTGDVPPTAIIGSFQQWLSSVDFTSSVLYFRTHDIDHFTCFAIPYSCCTNVSTLPFQILISLVPVPISKPQLENDALVYFVV
jgi:hypothetical protein